MKKLATLFITAALVSPVFAASTAPAAPTSTAAGLTKSTPVLAKKVLKKKPLSRKRHIKPVAPAES